MSRVVIDNIDKIILEQLGNPVRNGLDDTLRDDLGADSLDLVEMLMAMEEYFEIEVPDEIAETIVTVSDVYNYVMANTETYTGVSNGS